MKHTYKNLNCIIILAAVCILLSSCATFSYYYPQKAFQPLVQDKSDVQIAGGYMSTNQFKGFNFDGAYAFSKHSFGSIGFDFGNGSTDQLGVFINSNDGGDSLVKSNLTIKNNIGQVRLGYGYFAKVGLHWTLGGHATFGSGSVNYKSLNIDKQNAQNAARSVTFNNIGVGLFATFHTKYLDVSFMPNYVSTQFSKVTNDAAIAKGTKYEKDLDYFSNGKITGFFQPAIQINLGVDKLKVFANYTSNAPTGNAVFAYDKKNFSFGLTALFDIGLNPVSK